MAELLTSGNEDNTIDEYGLALNSRTNGLRNSSFVSPEHAMLHKLMEELSRHPFRDTAPFIFTFGALVGAIRARRKVKYAGPED